MYTAIGVFWILFSLFLGIYIVGTGKKSTTYIKLGLWGIVFSFLIGGLFLFFIFLMQ